MDRAEGVAVVTVQRRPQRAGAQQVSSGGAVEGGVGVGVDPGLGHDRRWCRVRAGVVDQEQRALRGTLCDRDPGQVTGMAEQTFVGAHVGLAAFRRDPLRPRRGLGDQGVGETAAPGVDAVGEVVGVNAG